MKEPLSLDTPQPMKSPNPNLWLLLIFIKEKQSANLVAYFKAQIMVSELIRSQKKTRSFVFDSYLLDLKLKKEVAVEIKNTIQLDK